MSPTPPFLLVTPRLRLSGILGFICLVFPFTSSYSIIKAVGFFIGFGFFGDPVFTFGMGLLNRTIPDWKDQMDIQKYLILDSKSPDALLTHFQNTTERRPHQRPADIDTIPNRRNQFLSITTTPKLRRQRALMANPPQKVPSQTSNPRQRSRSFPRPPNHESQRPTPTTQTKEEIHIQTPQIRPPHYRNRDPRAHRARPRHGHRRLSAHKKPNNNAPKETFLFKTIRTLEIRRQVHEKTWRGGDRLHQGAAHLVLHDISVRGSG